MLIVVFKDVETARRYDAGEVIAKEDRTITGIVFCANTPEQGRAQALTLRYYKENPDKAELMRCVTGDSEDIEEIISEFM